MPWTELQVQTFRALAHGWKPKSKKLAGLLRVGRKKLYEMAKEGVKR